MLCPILPVTILYPLYTKMVLIEKVSREQPSTKKKKKKKATNTISDIFSLTTE